MKKAKPFHFKQFLIHHDQCAMKVGTDGVLLGAWANVLEDEHVLDIGTGSGLISIMLAQRNATAHITGIEIDESAARQALSNASLSPWKERLEMLHFSFQDFISMTEKKFNHIVSNPPFFQEGTNTSSKERNMARQTVSLTFEEIISGANQLLLENGKLSIILPVAESRLFYKIAIQYGFNLNRKLNVKSKKEKNIERILMEFSKKEKIPLKEKTLIIQHEKRNDWTDSYIELTGDFYLKM